MSTPEFLTGTRLVRSTYAPEDVTYLLREIQAQFVSVEEKERLIQSGERHYGQLLSPEQPPRPEYQALFERALHEGAPQLARHVAGLARVVHEEVRIRRRVNSAIVLVSLARGGTPIGVLVTRALRSLYGEEVHHYGVSIVRDHGIDGVALDFIRARHTDGSVIFLDGWTGKGVIAAELRRSVKTYNATRGSALQGELFVVSDPGGAAARCATRLDYLVPNAMLGATVAGLVSRTVLPGPAGDLHGSAFLAQLAAHDVTRHFVDTVSLHFPGQAPPEGNRLSGQDVYKAAQTFLHDVQHHAGPRPVNHVKPGVGEATRVLLRRAPEVLILRDPHAPEVQHLLSLAQERQVPVQVWPGVMPYSACALIRSVEPDP
ncbi:cysteine protease StiP family protein [Deinococcus peraridilitoris]|uniref:Uncharacterized protein n=1 Tax=Deinococcus peraridilitoris (strain DSM 19664 / LMG 22246 / CIP 109416 / KR-200) TaxID=937777 RepID=L0A1Y2_DEIPD|nr:cysteine protease StiP family protein [Deinococcus peraridilitoris]AFZ67459.1 Protein of unknown function (DUF2983) [Deinococcus peraridilitoris DSM 19664]